MAAQERKKKLLPEIFQIFECLLTQNPTKSRFTTLLIFQHYMEDC